MSSVGDGFAAGDVEAAAAVDGEKNVGRIQRELGSTKGNHERRSWYHVLAASMPS